MNNMLKKTFHVALCLFACVWLAGPLPPIPGIPNDPASREARAKYELAKIDEKNRDWDSAMENILLALEAKKDKEKDNDHVRALERIATEYYKLHESAARANLDPVKIPVMKQECDLMTHTAARIENLSLTKGRGKKAAPLAPKPSQEMMEVCQVAPQTCANQRYTAGLDHETAGHFRNAAIAYREAFTCVSGFEDAEARYTACRSKAMVTVALLDGENAPGLPGNLAQHACLSIKDMAADLKKIQGGSLEFVNLIDATTFRSQAAAAGSKLRNASDVGRAAKKIGGISKVIVLNPKSFDSEFQELTYEEVPLGHDSESGELNCIGYIFETGSKVQIGISYDLIDTGGKLLKTSLLSIEDVDWYSWARFEPISTSGGETDLGGILDPFIDTLGCALAAKLNSRINPLLKSPEGTPLSVDALTTRAEAKAGEKIFDEIQALL